MSRLLVSAGKTQEAAAIEIELAREAAARSDFERSIYFLEQAAAHRRNSEGPSPCDAAFIAAALEVSQLSVVMGKDFANISSLLEEARTCTEKLGDRRSRALIDLHLGRLFYFSARRPEALVLLSSGWKEVEELGDADIMSQSAEFVGLLFFLKGLFKEAMVHFEHIMVSHRGGKPINPLAPIFMGLCAGFLGHFHRAIGLLDSYWRTAQIEGDKSLAASYRSVLGLTLLRVLKSKEGVFHLQGALNDGLEVHNSLAVYLARAGLARSFFLQGRTSEAHDILAQAVAEAMPSGIIRQYSSPYTLEMLYEYDRLGYDPIPGMDFHSQVERAIAEPSVHLRGVVMRLKAREALARAEEITVAQSLLETSEDLLKRSNDPVELAETWIEMARLALKTGDPARARELAHRAWEGLMGYTDEFFPDDLRYLLEPPEGNLGRKRADTPEAMLQRFFVMLEDLAPSPDLNEFLTRAVAASNRFLGAERGGLFWIQSNGGQARPILRAACGLTEKEVNSDHFRSTLALIMKTFHEGRPLLVHPKKSGRSQIFLPVEADGMVRGVFYHDNSYLENCFDFLDGPLSMRLVKHISAFVDRIWEYGQLSQKRSRSASQKAMDAEPSVETNVLCRSPVMSNLLGKAERIARSDSIVLVLGETGVGKGLLARWIHSKSSRRDGPFVVINVPTIPDNLLESELFGHEKGAFTGADHQKKGRIELAHGGTLFLDEIGDLPLSIQSKLLWLLDEKTFVRLGGNRVLSADFRLMAATNRDLAREVSAGRFRQDLYYRLNVVPLVIPPLRERSEDVVYLAHHFIRHYAAHFEREIPALTPGDEAKLSRYSWPGNVRELKNVIERAVLLATGDHFSLDLPLAVNSELNNPLADRPSMDELQGRYIRLVLEECGNRISGKGGAAEVLGMDKVTLYRRLKKMGLR
ncbi:MAG: sigma-54 dependent transcriptional regulator [Acidobacteriota bacterium]